MALQASGTIKLSEVQTEFGGSNPISISEYYGSDTVPASGVISLSDFYGTASGPTIEIGDGTISDVVVSPAGAVATLTIKNDGTISTSGNGGSYTDTAWADPTGVGTGDDYEIQVTATGSGGTSFTGTLGSWVALTTDKSWTLSQTGTGNGSRDLTVSIRDTATSTVQDTASITLSVLVTI